MKEKVDIRLVDRKPLFHLFKAEFFNPACSKSLTVAEYNAREDMEWLLGNKMC